MNKVNTLIIGAGRSGTTTLSKLMENHPNICFSKIKEVHYFSISDLYKRGDDYFHSFFSDCKNKQIIASADTYLLPAYNAIKRIKNYNPEMKIIVMLRNPVDRAYSSYNYSVNYGYHNSYENFTDSINKEENIENETDIVKLNNLGHFYCSLYYKHLERWMSELPAENFLFLTINELKNSTDTFNSKLSEFLGITPFNDNSTGSKKHNANAIPRNKTVEQFLLNRENP
ncbi:MAG: sulfotransferase domain-containing protein, partial [Chlorobi bacterium]|nr:sulfotransferase domain-containing protein [Chlorobiota bacterium]